MDLARNTVRKRPVSGVVRKRPAAAAAEQPRPPPPAPVFTTPRPTSRLGYASDCSGLDCGSLALHKMGLPFDHLFASEVNPDYRAILSATHAVESVFPDITTRAEDSLRPFRGRVTIYTAGFPCQPYSRQGSQGGESDPSGRGMVVWDVLLAIDVLQPDAFVLENVKDFARFQSTFEPVLDMLRAIGNGSYTVSWRILGSLGVGVPHRRERLYIVGIRRDRQCATWVWPEPGPLVGLDTILDPTPDHGEDIASGLQKLTATALHNLQSGLAKLSDHRHGSAVIDLGASPSFGTTVTYDHMPTITKTRAGRHDYWLTARNRRISQPELLKCQGINPAMVCVPPDVNPRKLSEMVGNAYTVTVFQHIFAKILLALGR